MARVPVARVGEAVAIAVLVADAGNARIPSARTKAEGHPMTANQTQRSIEHLLGTASGTEAILSPSPVSSILKNATTQVRTAAKTVATAVVGGAVTSGPLPNS